MSLIIIQVGYQSLKNDTKKEVNHLLYIYIDNRCGPQNHFQRITYLPVIFIIKKKKEKKGNNRPNRHS